MVHGREQSHEGTPEGIRHQPRDEPEIDRILAESFPASDPPPWTPGVARIYQEQATAAAPRSGDAPPRTR